MEAITTSFSQMCPAFIKNVWKKNAVDKHSSLFWFPVSDETKKVFNASTTDGLENERRLEKSKKKTLSKPQNLKPTLAVASFAKKYYIHDLAH